MKQRFTPLSRLDTSARSGLRALATVVALWAGAAPAGAQQAPDLGSVSLEDLMKVTITSASRREQTMFDTTAAVYVISQDDIRRSGFASVPELLRLAPGVEVARIDANKWAIAIRGFNFRWSNKLLVLLDGRTIYSRIQSGVFWETVDLPVELIDRIEVVRGPGGSLWGSNAVDGVINILTKPAAATRGGMFRTGIGTRGTRQGYLQYSGTAGGADYRVYGQWFDRGHSLDPGSRTAGGDATRSGTGGFRVDRTWIRDDVTIDGSLSRGESGTRLAAITGPVAPSGGWPVASFTGDWLTTSLRGQWTHSADSDSSLRVQASADRLIGDNSAGSGGVSDDATTLDVDLTYRRKVGRQQLVSGAEYRRTHDTVPASFSFSVTPGHLDIVTANLFTQDEISLAGNRLLITVGNKLEHDTLGGVNLQPTARALWKVDARQRLWTAISRAWRTPARVDRGLAVNFASFPGQGGLPVVLGLRGNPAYESEELNGLEAGYRVDLGPSLSLDVAAFANHYNGLQSLEPQAPVVEVSNGQPYLLIVDLFGNKQRADTRGAEVTSSWRPVPWWQLQGSVSVFHFTPHPMSDSVDPLTATADGNAPAHQWQLRSTVTLGSHFDLTASAFGVGALRVREVRAYTRADFQLTWKVTPQVSVSTDGQNLFGAGHTEFLGQDNAATPMLNSRALSVQTRWRF